MTRKTRRARIEILVGGLFILEFLLLIGLRNQSSPIIPHHLLLHTTFEFISVVISAMVFAIGWTARNVKNQRSLLLLSCGFLAVALLDFSHVLTYEGMPEFFTQSSPETTVHFWLAARYVAALALFASVIAAVSANQQGDTCSPVGRRCLVVAVLLAVLGFHVVFLMFPAVMPAVFSSSDGLTSFKVGAEYGLICIHLATAAILLLCGQRSLVFHRELLLAAVSVMALSEVFFTLYRHPSDMYGLLGHVYKVIAYALLYRAVFVEMVVAPFQTMQESTSHLEAVLAAIPDLMFEIDSEGQVLSVHASRPEQLLVPAADLLGKNVADFLPETALQVSREALSEAALHGYSQGRELALDLAVGRRYFELSIARKLEDTVRPQYIVLSRDVTDRVLDRDTLRKLQLAVEQSPSIITITDLDSRLEYANRAFVTTTGYSLKEALGTTPSLLHSGKTPKSTYVDLWRSLNKRIPWRGEFINRRKDGSEYLEAVQISPVLDESGTVTSYLAIKEDITQRKKDQERLDQLANFDTLTGLPNRILFAERFVRALDQSRQSKRQLALLHLGLEGFKHVNESFGYAAGDALLVNVAERVIDALRGNCIIARHGGNEFLVALPMTCIKDVVHMAEHLQATVHRPFQINGYDVVCTVSIGIAMFPEDGESLDSLEQVAAIAMHEAQEEGRGLYRFFSVDMRSRSARTLRLESALRTALESEQMLVHYQPQVAVDDGRLIGVEALLRWNHPELGAVSPAEFIPIAESTGQIVAIGEWVLRTALLQAREWLDAGYPDLVLAVNLSLAQFKHPGLLGMLETVLAQTGYPGPNLELELTESVAMDDPERVVAIVESLRALSIRLSLDDFGTGYSSLSYLKRLRLHKLKIDTSFVRDIVSDSTDVSIVTAILSMSRSLGMITIAEGVETPQQLKVLRELGCEEAQGYLFSRPLSAAELSLWLKQEAARVSLVVAR